MRNLNDNDLELMLYELRFAKTDSDRLAIISKYKPDAGKPPYRVFLFSPADVDNVGNKILSGNIKQISLRDATEEVFNEFNKLSVEKLFHVYRWETALSAGFTEDYQSDIFKAFGDWCDICIFIFWTSIGSGNFEKEYQEFLSKYKVINKNIKPWVCWYAQPVIPQEIKCPVKLGELLKFYNDNLHNWKLLGIKENTIVTPEELKSAIRHEVNIFIKETSS